MRLGAPVLSPHNTIWLGPCDKGTSDPEGQSDLLHSHGYYHRDLVPEDCEQIDYG